MGCCCLCLWCRSYCCRRLFVSCTCISGCGFVLLHRVGGVLGVVLFVVVGMSVALGVQLAVV